MPSALVPCPEVLGHRRVERHRRRGENLLHATGSGWSRHRDVDQLGLTDFVWIAVWHSGSNPTGSDETRGQVDFSALGEALVLLILGDAFFLFPLRFPCTRGMD